MHTQIFIDEDDNNWTIHHNGDWSGPAHIHIPEGYEDYGVEYSDKEHGIIDRITLPGKLLKSLAFNEAVNDAIAKLEDLEP